MPMPATNSEPAGPAVSLAAAILDRSGVKGDVDVLLARITQAQQRAGRRVHGVLMNLADGAGSCAAGDMVLIDIQTLDRYLVSQPMGRDSTACRADAQGFARASQVLRNALAASPDLVISNRFGSLEAEGAGFADEMLALMAAGIPLLTVVAERHLAAWQHFSGGATVLVDEAQAVQDWLDSVLPATPAN